MENIEITFNTVLQFFGAVAVIGGGVKILVNLFSPFKEVKEKLKKHDELIKGDKQQLDSVEETLTRIEESQRVQGKAIMELLNHIITGNDIEELKNRHTELMNHYIEQ